MVLEAEVAGLHTGKFGRELERYEEIEVKKSLTWEWWLFEIIPFKRLTFKDGKKTTHWLVLLEMTPYP